MPCAWSPLSDQAWSNFKRRRKNTNQSFEPMLFRFVISLLDRTLRIRHSTIQIVIEINSIEKTNDHLSSGNFRSTGFVEQEQQQVLYHLIDMFRRYSLNIRHICSRTSNTTFVLSIWQNLSFFFSMLEQSQQYGRHSDERLMTRAIFYVDDYLD